MGLKELIAPFMVMIQTNTVEPPGFFFCVQFFQAFVLGFFTIGQRVVSRFKQVVKQQQVGAATKFVTAIRATIINFYFGIKVITILLLTKRQFVPPLGKR